MSALSTIMNADIRKALGSMAFGKAVLAINAALAATVKTTNAITYTVDGIALSKAALAAQSIAVTHDCFGNLVANGVAAYVQPASTTVYYLLSLDSAGGIKVSQGSYAGQALAFPGDISRINTGTGAIPAEPAGCTAFGLIKVVTAAATTFNPGATALDAANVTVTYSDLSMVPPVAP
jgi:hypothetical protein